MPLYTVCRLSVMTEKMTSPMVGGVHSSSPPYITWWTSRHLSDSYRHWLYIWCFIYLPLHVWFICDYNWENVRSRWLSYSALAAEEDGSGCDENRSSMRAEISSHVCVSAIVCPLVDGSGALPVLWYQWCNRPLGISLSASPEMVRCTMPRKIVIHVLRYWWTKGYPHQLRCFSAPPWLRNDCIFVWFYTATLPGYNYYKVGWFACLLLSLYLSVRVGGEFVDEDLNITLGHLRNFVMRISIMPEATPTCLLYCVCIVNWMWRLYLSP